MPLPAARAPQAELPEAWAADGRAMGAPENEARLDEWLASYEASFADRGHHAFGPVPLYGRADCAASCWWSEAPFPMARRAEGV